MPNSSRSSLFNLVAAFLGIVALLLPPFFLLHAERHRDDREPQRIIAAYLKAAYAHDFKRAYALISNEDRSYKSERAYIREKGPFTGFTLDVASKLAGLIESRTSESTRDGPRLRVKLNLRLPDASSLSPLLFDWDEEKLNRLPKAAQLRILDEIDRLDRKGELKMVEGPEEFALVKEGNSWRIFLDLASGLVINYHATVPDGAGIDAIPLTKQTVVRPGDVFTVAYRVKNQSGKMLTTRIVHRVQPAELRQQIDIVECALLLPVKMPAGQDAEFSTTYMVRSDLPDDAKKLDITYEFQIER